MSPTGNSFGFVIAWPDASPEELRAYLFGATKDSTRSAIHNTVRYGQSEITWLETIAAILARLSIRSWMYREGRTRNFWVLETTAPFLRSAFDPREADEGPSLAYARGYFDADGGMPRLPGARLYFQYIQKDHEDLSLVRDLLLRASIECGTLHNPSRAADPNYWRFFVSARSHLDFMMKVGSWHPVKAALITERLSALQERETGRPALGIR